CGPGRGGRGGVRPLAVRAARRRRLVLLACSVYRPLVRSTGRQPTLVDRPPTDCCASMRRARAAVPARNGSMRYLPRRRRGTRVVRSRLRSFFLPTRLRRFLPTDPIRRPLNPPVGGGPGGAGRLPCSYLDLVACSERSGPKRGHARDTPRRRRCPGWPSRPP